MRYLILFYSVSFLSFVSSLSVAQEKRITIEEFKNTHAVAIEALKKSARSESKAAEILEKWTPEDEYFKTYKKFWSVLWVDDFSAIRSLYEDLKKQNNLGPPGPFAQIANYVWPLLVFPYLAE